MVDNDFLKGKYALVTFFMVFNGSSNYVLNAAYPNVLISCGPTGLAVWKVTHH